MQRLIALIERAGTLARRRVVPGPRAREPVAAATAPAGEAGFGSGSEAATDPLAERLAVLAGLWGEGFIGPGGEEEVLRLAKPLGLSPSNSVLHLGAGLGGGTLAIARATGAYVNGYVLDASLVEAATLAAQKAGLAKRATIEALNPAAPGLRHGYFHHAIAQEALWPLADKEPVVAALARAVKRGGQVMLTDLVRAEDDPTDHAWAAWAALQRFRPHPATEKAIGRALAGQALDIRVVEDVTRRHVGQALEAWMTRVALLRAARPSVRQAALLVCEAELWLRRCRLMQEGRIRLLRWHALVTR